MVSSPLPFAPLAGPARNFKAGDSLEDGVTPGEGIRLQNIF